VKTFSVVGTGMSFFTITSVFVALNFFRVLNVDVETYTGDPGEMVEAFLKENKRSTVSKHATKQIKKIFI
jgi:hypothetical protein